MSEGDDNDKSAKTEEPSQKKLEEAIQKGQVINSKEVNSFIMFLMLTMLFIWVIPVITSGIGIDLRFFVENAGQIKLHDNNIAVLLIKIMKLSLFYVSPILAVVVISAFISAYIQHGEFVFTSEQLQPKLSKISITKGFSRIFSVKNLVEFLKGIFKITLVGGFVYIVIMADIKELTQYQELSLAGILEQLKIMMFDVLVLVTIIMAVIAAVDYSYQKYDHYSELKMTKQEVKEEYKQTEGSPEVKQKIRSLRRQHSQRMIKNTVPNATVVITNPEHYAVALKYKLNEMDVPVCVAKGVDFAAQKIKALAQEHGVPVVESPPLARALYKDVKIDQEIPVEHFAAVAKIISYVMTLEREKNKKSTV